MTIFSFPMKRIRGENFALSERNRIDDAIHAKEQEIAKLSHAIWLLKLERTQYEDDIRG